jgi:predicted XRE-type DNA-binding protein
MRRTTTIKGNEMAKRTPELEIPVTKGRDNVYADLGFDNPAEELAKAQLAMMIEDVIRERGLTQVAAARLMGVDQPKVSHILHGRLGGFSTQRLIEFLTALGRDVEIVVRPAPRSRKRGRLLVAARMKVSASLGRVVLR